MSESLRHPDQETEVPASSGRILVLARHGQSVWNAESRFTGWMDVELTAQGRAEAKRTAARLKAANISFDTVFCSPLKRALETARIVLAELDISGVLLRADPALYERDYGELAGVGRAKANELYGAEQVRRWRRSYTERPPGGESLRDAQARLLSFHVQTILPGVMAGRRTLYVGHGNTVRALAMAFENVSPEAVEGLEVRTGEALIYTFDKDAVVRRAPTTECP